MSDPRRLRLWLYRAIAVLLGTLAWAALPGRVSADNCSGLSDCYGTVASALAATVGIALVLATVVSLPSILSALESMAARSLDPGALRDATDATAGSSVAPAQGGDTDLSRGSHPDPQAAQSLAKAPLRPPDQSGVPYAGPCADAPPQVSPPDAVPPHQQASFVRVVGGQGGDMQNLGRGYGGPPGPAPAAPPQGQDFSPAQPLHDLSRGGSPAAPPGSFGSGPAASPGDLSRGAGRPDFGAAGPPVAPTGAGGSAVPSYGQDLGRNPLPGGVGGDAMPPASPAAGTAAGGFASASPSGGDALSPGQGGMHGAGTPVGYRESGQDLSAGQPPMGYREAGRDLSAEQHPVAQPGGVPHQGGVAGGAETGPAAGQTDLTRGQAVPGTGGDQSMARGGAPIGGEQTLARSGGPPGAPVPPAAPTAGDASPGRPYDAPVAQPAAGTGEMGRASIAPGGSGTAPPPPPGGMGLVPSGLPDASAPGVPAGDALGSSFGAAVAQQVLGQSPYLDHTAQLVAAAQGVGPGALGGADGAAVAAAIVRGLGLEAGPALDLGGVIVTPSADATQALRFLKASGTFEVGPLDPQARALLLVGAAIMLDPSRGRPAFGRYLRWAESGAQPDVLERDLDLAIVRAAGLTRIGQVRRADVLRVLGPADQEWVSGNRYAGYRVAEWPGYLYVFEFDAAEILRNQGFVATPAPSPGTPLAAGMTRDAAWSRLGPPGAADGWWPFERWRYRFPDGRVETYEFAHGILRRALRG